LELLRQNSLTDFDSFYSLPLGEVAKRVRKDRFTSRITLKLNGKDFQAYMKRSRYSVLADLWKTIRKFTRQRSAFLNEYNALLLLSKSGVPTITPIAAGIKRKWLSRESFILSASLGETVKLADWAPQQLTTKDAQTEKTKRALIEHLAQITRKMHECGVNHRDFYLTHIHVKKDKPPEPSLFVIDLNRADIRKKVPLRWRVKDIAALNFSAPANVFTRADRIRFLKAYLCVERLTKAEKKFVRRVIRKSTQIARRAPRAMERDREFIATEAQRHREK
jgi:heptose I phosphotransferase